MDHAHEFESISHPNVSPEAAELGIHAVEIKHCRVCGKINVLVQLRKKWVPLIEDSDVSEKSILLA